MQNNLKLWLMGTLAMTLGASPATQPLAQSSTSANHVAGDYVEARTASVFAGGCHYNAELVTTGRDLILGCKINSGIWNGVDVSGAIAMAAVSSEDNLQNTAASRKSEIVVSSACSDAQRAALVDLLEQHLGQQLGTVVSVRSGAVGFDHTGSTYTVKSAGFASMAVQSMPNDECCKQPSNVWYAPLLTLDHRKVGYTLDSSYQAGTVGDCWERSGENTAFYGAFHF
jgi:hypothetical protein